LAKIQQELAEKQASLTQKDEEISKQK